MPILDWDEQTEIINQCIQNNKPLHETLTNAGHSYNDLVYEHKCQINGTGEKYKSVDNLSVLPPNTPIISFFSGCGGLDLGFESAGFEHLACIDNNELFCNTLRINRPKWNVIGPPNEDGDISDRKKIFNKLNKHITTPFEGMFIGGPPCQPFSVASNQRFQKGDSNFKRVGFAHETNGNLLSDYVWYIKRFKPQAFLIENVTGLASIDGGEQLNKVLSTLSKADYSVTKPHIIDAVDYGVPQYRKRLFIVGSRKGLFKFPDANDKKIPCSNALNLPKKDIKNHITRKHTAKSIKRYIMLKCGERDKHGRVNRLEANRPSLTVIAGGCQGGGRSHLHPTIPRTLSVRECARLQTFPDSFVFYGPIARQFTQVGNAVPPVLAYHLATSIAQQIFEVS